MSPIRTATPANGTPGTGRVKTDPPASAARSVGQPLRDTWPVMTRFWRVLALRSASRRCGGTR